MSRLDDPSFGRPPHLRVEGSRVLMNLPASARPAAMPSSTGRAVLQTRRAPTQLSLFPPPGLVTPTRGQR
jgi:hypothetical protein